MQVETTRVTHLQDNVTQERLIQYTAASDGCNAEAEHSERARQAQHVQKHIVCFIMYYLGLARSEVCMM
jgi:hypothetical protein